MEIDRNGLEVLDRTQCLDLLRSAHVGRVGLSSGALPLVVPVDFAVVGDRIVLHTARGTLLDLATRDTVVAFEADDIDRHDRTGWSVVVTGLAVDVPASHVPAHDRDRLATWASGTDGRFVGITTHVVSGRRTRAGEPVPQRADGHMEWSG
jgi:nitroimidazol reductase NimA-like FMN-containing flavoprotein (pyridoxamine 5'-phosphate oxidase superfamily)